MGRLDAGVLGIAIPARGGEGIVSTESKVPGPLLWEETDAGLVAKAQDGDVGAFGELLRRYSRTVYGVVSRMVANPDDVDDIAQDVFVRAYRSIRTFRRESGFSTWVYRIAVNTTIKEMKRIKTRQGSSIDDPATGLADILVSPEAGRPEKIAQRKARSEALRAAVLALPEKHRTVVVLHYYENLACDEIARVLQCSVGTVWSRLHYACKKLQNALSCEL
jgi:RNA polymerase sigma-70 factor (ECF subfamily)